MRIAKLNIRDLEATVILGAGASRGADCFSEPHLKAPLDKDFFSVMQLVQHKEDRLQVFLEFIRKEFGNGPLMRMEECFSKLQAISVYHESVNPGRGRRVAKYDKPLQDFVSTTAILFRNIFLDKSGNHVECTYHDKLARVLSRGDAIISFNYDCLMDDALRRCSGAEWNADHGYCFSKPWKGEMAPWQSKDKRNGRLSHNSIKLLKLHGSLNWRFDGGKVHLREQPYSTKPKRSKDELIPPVSNKTGTLSDWLCPIWREAANSLSNSKVLISIGYSIPATDYHCEALLSQIRKRRGTGNDSFHYVIVANPDELAAHRLLNLLGDCVSNKTKVITVRKLKELFDLL
jgi:hypothetical protein